MAQSIMRKIRMEVATQDTPVRIKFIQKPAPHTTGPVYLLDLDNTLHHASRYILPEIHRQMTDYLIESLQIDLDQANHFRDSYWKRYGATLLGMMEKHQTDPHHFLANTHRFPNLREVSYRHGHVPYRLSKLQGVRILLTNAPRKYAVDVLKTLGLYRHLHAVVSVEDMVIHQRWRPKPSTWLWQHLRKQLMVGKSHSSKLVLVDDTLGHLHSASRHGIQTVWVTFPEVGFKPFLPKGRVKNRIKDFEQIRRLTPGFRTQRNGGPS